MKKVGIWLQQDIMGICNASRLLLVIFVESYVLLVPRCDLMLRVLVAANVLGYRAEITCTSALSHYSSMFS